MKFYISYLDIENLGYEREEIWYDRERSEQLFWQMMEEDQLQRRFPSGRTVMDSSSSAGKRPGNYCNESKNRKTRRIPDPDDFGLPLEEKMEDFLENKYGKDLEQNDDDMMEEGL